ncbi:MAG: PH domain-containing protein [Acidobacteriota bacterium]
MSALAAAETGLLARLRVTARPTPPPGAGPDLRIFRASRRHLSYLYVGWTLNQLGALIGILLSLAYFAGWDIPFLPFDPVAAWLGDAVSIGPFEVDLRLWIHRLEIFALSTFALQAAFSGWLLHLRWRLHWYLVGDEMMRIRRGLWTVREQTFTISKIQNMSVHQNIVQRLLGIGSLEVHTAGGGSGKPSVDGEDPLHVAWFRGMDDPWALRDALRERLARCRGAGLGDEDDDQDSDDHAAETQASSTTGAAPSELLAAALALRDEARELRAAATSRR